MNFLEPKYLLSVLIAVSTSFCASFPIRADYLTTIKKLDPDDHDWAATMYAIQWMPNFIFFMPIIFGYLVDTIGVLAMLLPMQLILLVGQIMLTIGAISEKNQELTALIGYFFVSFSYKGIELSQTVFLVNTFVRFDKDTKVYQKLVLISKFINAVLIESTLLWQGSQDLVSGEVIGCCLCLLGITITILLLRSSWVKNNVEEISSNSSILNPIARPNSDRIDFTFSMFNQRGTTEEYFEKDPIGLNSTILLLMVGYACGSYLLDTCAMYYQTAFGFASSSSLNGWSLAPTVIELVSIGAYSFFFLSEKLLGRLIFASCCLLFVAVVLSFAKIFSVLLFFLAFAINPGLSDLYLPFLVKMNFKRLGLFVGCYMWLDVCVNIFALGYGAVIGKNEKSYFNYLIDFHWGGSNFYTFVAVPFVFIMLISLIIYTRSQKLNEQPKEERKTTFALEEEEEKPEERKEGDNVNLSMTIFKSDKQPDGMLEDHRELGSFS